MSDDAALEVGFVYQDDAHLSAASGGVEAAGASGAERVGSQGLYGRHVANSEFLEAWLTSGDRQRLLGVVPSQQSANSLAALFARHSRAAAGDRKLEIVPLQRFHERFLSSPPTQVLHLPQPVDAEFGWARHHKARHAFALSGVTHTLSLKEVRRWRSIPSKRPRRSRACSRTPRCERAWARPVGRVFEEYTWPRVIRRYQDVWREQEIVRREHASRVESSTLRTLGRP